MAEESTPAPHGEKKKSGSGTAIWKDKRVLAGFGIFALLGVIFVAVHSSNKNASQSSGTGQSAGSPTDPATGFPYGSFADSQALGGGYAGGSSGGSSGGSQPPVSITINNPPGSTTPGTGSTGGTSSGGSKHPPGGGTPPHHHSNTYTVKPGDNLSAIASRLHISGGWQSIYNKNRHTIGGNPNLILPGQKLTLP